MAAAPSMSLDSAGTVPVPGLRHGAQQRVLTCGAQDAGLIPMATHTHTHESSWTLTHSASLSYDHVPRCVPYYADGSSENCTVGTSGVESLGAQLQPSYTLDVQRQLPATFLFFDDWNGTLFELSNTTFWVGDCDLLAYGSGTKSGERALIGAGLAGLHHKLLLLAGFALTSLIS